MHLIRQGKSAIELDDNLFMQKKKENIKEYYVDESGDLTLFNKRHKIIIGNEGVSKYFMAGVATIDNIEIAEQKLENLRADLLADPYFTGIPSFDQKKKKDRVVFSRKK